MTSSHDNISGQTGGTLLGSELHQDISLTQLNLGSYRYFRAMDGFVALNLTKATGMAAGGVVGLRLPPSMPRLPPGNKALVGGD